MLIHYSHDSAVMKEPSLDVDDRCQSIVLALTKKGTDSAAAPISNLSRVDQRRLRAMAENVRHGHQDIAVLEAEVRKLLVSPVVKQVAVRRSNSAGRTTHAR